MTPTKTTTMRPITLYVAGPMTGLPELNFPAFHAAAAELRAKGIEAINPAEINPDKHMTWQACMRTDIAALVFCDGIHLLRGWRNSKGATLEHDIALRLGLSITYPEGEGAPLPVAYHYRYKSTLGSDVWGIGFNVPNYALEWHPLGHVAKQPTQATAVPEVAL